MRVSADLARASLNVVLDLRHPYAYLALGPTAALGDELGVDINWLPLRVPTLKPPSPPAAGDDRGVRHRHHRANAIAREIEVYSAAQGLVLSDYYRDGDPQAANLGWLWLRANHRARLFPFLNDVFRAYWSLELDPARLDQVSEMVNSHSADGTAFRAWAESQGPAVLDSLASELQEFGLYQAPAYIVEAEVFYGRQHLPMIRWILGGREGPGPI